MNDPAIAVRCGQRGLRPAAPERLPAETVAEQAREAATASAILAVLEAFPGPAALLNDRRQIVFANNGFRAAVVDLQPGMRPGDALGCTEAFRGQDGCGTAPACAVCGVGRNLLLLERGAAGPLREECLLTRRGPDGEESLEFEAGLTRLPGGLTMLALRDISDEKRRRVLERAFLHDALNAAGGVQGLADLAAAGDQTLGRMLPAAAAALVEELRHHQMLLAAEAGDLTVRIEPVELGAICADVAAICAGHRPGYGRRVVIAVDGLVVAADRVLLRRCLANLLKNALEASRPGDLVHVSARRNGGRVEIAIRNPGEMSPEVQAQVFRRSFSTKAARGRGIGTWSVKLLAERYLGGSVAFACGDGSTEFVLTLPPA